MSVNNFLTEENIATIWDVISDEEIFKLLSREKQAKVLLAFKENLNTFFNTQKTKSINLMDVNKKYILLILKYIRDKFSSEPNKIKIHNESVNTLVTYEEIQNERVSRFDRDLNARQQEFENAIKIKPPPVPEFGDKLEDKPITDMDRILKEMTEKRNYEVLSIANQTQNQNQNSDSWLKPQETSIQNEKLQKPQNKTNNNGNNNNGNNNGNRLKYIKIENDEISLTNGPKKNVSWDQKLSTDIQVTDIQATDIQVTDIQATDIPVKENNMSEGINIFNKLKKTEQPDRITVLEHEVKNLNSKIEMILDLLNKK